MCIFIWLILVIYDHLNAVNDYCSGILYFLQEEQIGVLKQRNTKKPEPLIQITTGMNGICENRHCVWRNCVPKGRIHLKLTLPLPTKCTKTKVKLYQSLAHPKQTKRPRRQQLEEWAPAVPQSVQSHISLD